MQRVSITIVIAFLSLIMPVITAADQPKLPPVSIDAGFERLQLGRYIEVLEDPTGRWTIDDVASLPLAAEFIPHPADTFNAGFSRSAYWYRFRVERAAGANVSPLVLAATRPAIQEMDLYVPLAVPEAGTLAHLKAGFPQRGLANEAGHRFPALRLPSNMNYGAYCYLRIRTQVHTYAITLFSQDAFARQSRFEYCFFGLTTGIMLAMLLYNLAIAVILREWVYGTYCLYIASVNPYLAMLSGWPLGFGFSPALMMSVVLELFAITFFFAMLFSRMFLMTRGRHNVIDRIFVGIMGLSILVFALSMAGQSFLANRLAYLMGLVVPFVVVVCGAIRWHQNYRPARFYLLAWVVFLLSVVLFSATTLGILPYSFLFTNFLCLGAAIESILLAFALADRIRMLKEERALLEEQERRLVTLSITDALTGLFNKRYFLSKLQSEVEHAQRLNRPLSLLMVDVDHFKQFNDRYGHAAGDRMLAALGRTITNVVRNSDIPCRYGGEEFTLILPGADSQTAKSIAERLRLDFSIQRVLVKDGVMTGATISIGVGQLHPGEDSDALFEHTDRALYRAKSNGRDQVVSG